jgi:hypothetical protein
MTSGGTEYGEDFVAARLSVEIPEGSAQGIREITQEAERLRTTLEAVTRTDMTRYLEGMENAARRAAEAQANLTQQLQSYLSLASRGESPSMGVPQGAAIDPFRAAPQNLSARQPDPADVTSQIEQARTTNPREYLNMQQARGGLTAQDTTNISPQSIQQMANKISDREQAQREQTLHTDPTAQPSQQEAESGASSNDMAGKIQRGASLAGRVANEIGPGGNLITLGRMAAQGVGWARKKYSGAADRNQGSPPADSPDSSGTVGDAAAEEGGAAAVAEKSGGSLLAGLGGITAKMGIVGAAITGAITVFEKGGQAIQGLRNEASVRGGAGGEGAQVEMRARLLGMNPFISQDQARQIYQSVMSEGYADASGAGADNVIDFMKNNMTNLNMSVADSAKLLRGTIVGQREGDPDSVNHSLGQLREELDKIRTMSRDSALSTPEFTEGAMGLKNKLMAAGAPAGAAGQFGIAEESEYGSDQAVKGQMAKGAGDLTGSASGQALIKQFGGLGNAVPADLPPQLTTAYVMRQPGGAELLQKATDTTLRHFATQAAAGFKGDEASFLKSVYMFQLYVKSIEPSLDAASSLDAATQLFSKLTGIADPEPGAGSGAGGDGGGGPTSSDAGSGAPSGGGARTAPAPSGGGASIGGGGGGQHISVGQGNVQITLTPEASRLLKVQGPNPAPLTPLQQASNRGQADSYPNGSS